MIISLIAIASLSGCYLEILGAGVGGVMWAGNKVKEFADSINEPKSLRDTAASFKIGKTTKEEIRLYLGEPVISREELNVEIYSDLKDSSDFLLVNYVNGILHDYDLGSLKPLNAGYVVFDPAIKSVYIPWEHVDNFTGSELLTEPQKNKSSCDVLIASNNAGSIFLDHEYIGCGYCNDAFFYQNIHQGNHEIKACDNRYNRDPYTSVCSEIFNLECIEGEIVYLNININRNENIQHGYELDVMKDSGTFNWIKYHNSNSEKTTDIPE